MRTIHQRKKPWLAHTCWSDWVIILHERKLTRADSINFDLQGRAFLWGRNVAMANRNSIRYCLYLGLQSQCEVRSSSQIICWDSFHLHVMQKTLLRLMCVQLPFLYSKLILNYAHSSMIFMIDQALGVRITQWNEWSKVQRSSLLYWVFLPADRIANAQKMERAWRKMTMWWGFVQLWWWGFLHQICCHWSSFALIGLIPLLVLELGNP